MIPPIPSADPAIITFARSLLDAYRSRNEHFPDLPFVDFVWFMLIDLFLVGEEQGSISLSGIYAPVRVPKATVLRTIRRMVESGHLSTKRDPLDGRRTLVSLSVETHRRVEATLRTMRKILMSSDG